MTGSKRTTEWSNTKTTNPEAWHQKNRSPPHFEEIHYPVFLVQYPHYYKERNLRFLYVDIDIKTEQWNKQAGHRFEFNNTNDDDTTVPLLPATTTDGPFGDGGTSQGSGKSEEQNFEDKACRHPFFSFPVSRMRLIGWVWGDDCPEMIRQVCQGVTVLPPTADGYDCCHGWIDAVVQKLRHDVVLQEPRGFDDTAVRLGPRAEDDGTF